MKKTPVYSVYQIKLAGRVRYIGLTNSLKRRQAQHRRDAKADDLTKFFYKMKQTHHPVEDIVLEEIYSTSKKIEAIRYEAYLILKDYFSEKNLWQSAPHIIKYF